MRLLLPLILLCCCLSASVISAGQVPQPVPQASLKYLPTLKGVVNMYWPDMPMPAYFGGQVEQETCPSPKAKECWNPNTELKTSRENGFGLGQLTVAYNKDGSERFNAFTEVKGMSKDLRGWRWEDRFNAEMQMKALVIKNKFNWSRLKFPVADQNNKLAFLAVTYNAGLPITDIRLCKTIAGCDATRWWNNVELHSTKSKIAVAGYGKSFFAISREYPVNVIRVRSPKYTPYLTMEQ